MTYLLIAYCSLVVCSSLAGGWIPLLVHLTHTRMQLAISFVAGAMLGVGIIHLLPHAIYELRNVEDPLGAEPVDVAVGWMLTGFLLMFFVERLFHSHQHEPAEAGDAAHEGAGDHQHDDDAGASQHLHFDGPETPRNPPHRMAWAGAAAGLMLHSTIDGLALAASVAADWDSDGAGFALPAGLATFLVIVLHKPFDSMTIGTLMAAGGWSRGARHLMNVVYPLAIPCGVLLYALGAQRLAGSFLGCALAFASGTFLCIATSDLLPEIKFHSHDRIKLSAALLLGMCVALGIGALERNHHRHPAEHVPATQPR